MIQVHVWGGTAAMRRTADFLDSASGVERVVFSEALGNQAVVTGDVAHDRIDALIGELRSIGVAADDISFTRLEEVASAVRRATDGAFVWADVIGIAGSNARILGRYLVFMAAAGVIAAYGVLDSNSILIVGAMAISPDLLPITAAAVGLVARDLHLAGRALGVLAVGLGMSMLFACVTTALVDAFGGVPSRFTITSTVLRGLASAGGETIVVALVAGVAGMLAVETRASMSVGVAISVTTIPAVARLGVAAGLGDFTESLGAFEVLCLNVVMLMVGAGATLVIQRRLGRNGEDVAPGTTARRHVRRD